jgi:hypothetical protein
VIQVDAHAPFDKGWLVVQRPVRWGLRARKLSLDGMATRCPRLDCIYKIRGFAVKPTLELLISYSLESRAPVAPALNERVSRPLVSDRTLRGFGLSSLGLGPCEGPGHLMPTVVAAVVHHGRAFSGGATASVVGNVGGGRDGPPRPFGCRAVMIACARAPGRLATWGPLISGRCGYLQLMHAARVRGLGSTTPLDL